MQSKMHCTEQEVRLLALISFFTLISYFIVVVLTIILDDDVLNAGMVSAVGIFYGFSVIYIQTSWVIANIKTLASNDDPRGSLSEIDLNRVTSLRNSASNSSDNHQNRQKIGLHLVKILRNKDAFDLFMQHLSSEFSMECLLAFTEFTQFRMLLESDESFMSRTKNESVDKETYTQPESSCVDVNEQQRINLETPSTEPSVSEQVSTTPEKKKRVQPYKRVVLPTDIPQSIIVYGKRDVINDMTRYRHIALELFKKYVEIGSEFEINVSYAMRCVVERSTENVFRNNEIKDDLYLMFESCRRELYNLMKHSCRRFMDTEAYNTIENKMMATE